MRGALCPLSRAGEGRGTGPYCESLSAIFLRPQNDSAASIRENLVHSVHRGDKYGEQKVR